MSVPAPSPSRAFSLPMPEHASAFRKHATRVGERLFGLDALNDIHDAVMAHSGKGEGVPFCERAIDVFGATLEIEGLPEAERIADRPLVIAANHPFGGIEGIALDAVMRQLRPDLRVLATRMLSGVPELHESFIFVDNLEGTNTARANARPMKRAIQWVRDGGALGIFPSGEVASFKLSEFAVVEAPWHAFVGRVVQRCDAWVLPVFFEGRNRLRFHAAGLIHPRLRTAQLGLEMSAAKGRTIRMHVGPIMPPELWGRFRDARELTDYLRVRTELLRPRRRAWWKPRRQPVRPSRPASSPSEGAPLAEPIPRDELRRTVDSLPAEAALAYSGALRVLCIRHAHPSLLMREIGRVRELTFRAVGEGTGRACDLDDFDDHYHQLVLWDDRAGEVVGGYRMGATDELLPRFGLDGLYTSTLWKFRGGIFDQIDPALELGRSFVAPSHQRSHASLMLLWRGIGAFVAANPRYRRLFGPVSISAEYSSVSRELLVKFLSANVYLPHLARLIRPRNPLHEKPRRALKQPRFSRVVNDLDEVNQLVRELEQDGKPMPVLLRQYLKLNAKLLGFNLDPDFGNVLDGLMLVDLLTVDRRILDRYMGADNAERFIAHHAKAEQGGADAPACLWDRRASADAAHRTR